MKVIGSAFANPINAMPGWYVMIEGTKQEIYSAIPAELAKKEAEKNGYNPHGQTDKGIPSYSGGLYTRTFWFYTKR